MPTNLQIKTQVKLPTKTTKMIDHNLLWSLMLCTIYTFILDIYIIICILLPFFCRPSELSGIQL